MILVEFKEPVNGMKQVHCKSISSDPMNDNVFLIKFSESVFWEVYYKLIKHISSCK